MNTRPVLPTPAVEGGVWLLVYPNVTADEAPAMLWAEKGLSGIRPIGLLESTAPLLKHAFTDLRGLGSQDPIRSGPTGYCVGVSDRNAILGHPMWELILPSFFDVCKMSVA